MLNPEERNVAEGDTCCNRVRSHAWEREGGSSSERAIGKGEEGVVSGLREDGFLMSGDE